MGPDARLAARNLTRFSRSRSRRAAASERRCAFYLAEADGKQLRHIVGMPESYARAVDGFKISPESLACGLAVASGQPVITQDVLNEPRWQPWAGLAREYDYRACWSFPVETTSGKLIGSFAMYCKEPYSPTVRDRELVAAFTQAAAIIISHYQEAAERVRMDEELMRSLRQ